MYVTVHGVPATDSTTAPDPKPSGRGRSRLRSRLPGTVLALGTVSLLTDISSESVAAVLPLYITAVLGMGPLAYGFIDGIYQGISALVRLLGGWWADTSRRPKWIAFLGYAASALSRVGLLLTHGFWPISSVIAVDRLGKGLRTGPRDALIAASSHPNDLGRNFGVHRAMDTAGALIGPLLAFAILATFPYGLQGYKSVFAISAAFAVIGLAVMILAVPDLRQILPRMARPDSAGEVQAPVLPAEHRPRLADLTRPGLRRVLIVAGLLSLVTVGDGFIYLSLTESGALAQKYFPLMFAGTGAAYLLLAVPLGRLADRVGRWKVFIGGHVILLAVYVLAPMEHAGLLGMVAVLILLGTFYAATDGVLSALSAKAVPAASRASGISAAQTVVALARFGSSICFGVLWQLTGRGTAMLVVGIALVIVLPVSVWLLRTTAAEQKQAP